MSRRPSLRDNLNPRNDSVDTIAAPEKATPAPARPKAAKPKKKASPVKTMGAKTVEAKVTGATASRKSPAKEQPSQAISTPLPYTPAETEGREARLAESHGIVKRYSQWAAAAGLLPMPVLDTMGLTAVIIRMMAELNRVYRSHNDPGVARQAALTVAGVLGPKIAAVSTLKAIPGLGLAGMAVMPGLAAAGVWALGRYYLQHLDQGGSASDFDPQAAATIVQEELKKKG
ncbi:MAG: hypothetical protein KJ904_18300 [Alphaproteobacteria bacterium]|nr:hypothetical protein [Alphaproteobacteria bacterium]MBU0796864.1 hypothetical protein [Alphaproteobacteria bacterium]MBU0889111.1 hypothetical protein [Alphaproteobacteria bacterium]MBU1812145.1 hypothetical protein [Alphaproteobacteria bacterium]MBU2091891.1 hypothetical protein [Alphaproteobacteria bacterium]